MPPLSQAPAQPPFTQAPTPPPCPFIPILSFSPKPLPHPLALGHLLALGPPTPPNLNVSTIWVRNPWVSIQINFLGSLPPRKKCHTHVKYLTIFNCRFSLGHFVALGPLTFPNLNILTIWVRDPWVSIQINFWGPYYLQKKCHTHVKYLTIFNCRFSLGHFVALGPLTFPNLNILIVWVTEPWVSIQINFLGSLPPRKEVPHTCKILNYF